MIRHRLGGNENERFSTSPVEAAGLEAEAKPFQQITVLPEVKEANTFPISFCAALHERFIAMKAGESGLFHRGALVLL
jgi:hypothetical protein